MVLLGVVLLLCGTALLVAEAHLPTAGALGTGGVAALAGGAWFVVDGSGGGLAVAVPAAVIVLVTGMAGMLVAARALRASDRRAIHSGTERMTGSTATVRSWQGTTGQVAADGALWRARLSWSDDDDPAPQPGGSVVIEGIEGLTLVVRPAESWETL